MRDIVERLELQAFVAEKIQSGMKPLIMDCLEEITRLRAENETLRRDVKTAVMGDSSELQDVKRENEALLADTERLCMMLKEKDSELERLRQSYIPFAERHNELRAAVKQLFQDRTHKTFAQNLSALERYLEK